MNLESMELVDSYVYEVGQYLPGNIRKETVTTLYESIVEEVFEIADAADRVPTLADQQAVLQRFGHPFKVAGRYQPQRYLIGPELYPQLLQTLKVVLAVAIACLVIFMLTFAQVDGWTLGPLQLITASIEILVWIIIAVFAVFVVLEYSGERLRWYEDWTPTPANIKAVGVIKRSDVISNLLTEGVFLLWWNDVLVLMKILPVVDLSIGLSAAWTDYFWHLNIIMGTAFALHFYILVKGVWQRVTQMTEVVINVALLGVGAVLLLAETLVVVGVGPDGTSLESGSLGFLEMVLRWMIVVIMGFTLWDIWLGLKVLWGNPAATMAAHRSTDG